MRKKFLSIVLCVCMMLTMVPFAFAADASPVATVGGQSYETLSAAVNAAKSGDTITLSEGNFTTTGINKCTKTLTFIGSGTDKTTLTIGDLSTNTGSETNGDYSFDGSSQITFKNMNLKSDSSNYRGFIRIGTTNVESCTLDGRTTYWGYTAANFTNCTFNAPTEDYALWDYSSSSMTFDHCIFNVSGKAIHLYRESGDATVRNLVVKNCTVNSSKANKAAINIKNANQAYNVEISNTTVTGLTENETTGSNLYQVEKTGADGKALTVTIDDKTVWQNGAKVEEVAQIGDTVYTSLADAVSAAQPGVATTITMLKDVNLPARITINNGKNITLDLNNHNITHTGYAVFVIKGANFHVTGEGTIFENQKDGFAPIIAGGYKEDTTNYTTVTVDKDVTLKGDYAGIFVDTDNGGENSYNNYGLIINMNGSIDLTAITDGVSSYGIYVQGSNKVSSGNVMQINLDGTRIKTGEEAIYAAGYAKWNLKNCTFTAENAAIELRAGEMTIDGGNYTATATEFKCEANGNGSTTQGAALAIMQHTTKLPMNISIKNGTFNGQAAVAEKNIQKNDPNPTVTLTIEGGMFNGLVEADDASNFISGGYFTSDPSAYCVGGKTGIPSDKSGYAFMVGTANTTVDVTPVTGTPAVDEKALDSLNVSNSQKDEIKTAASNVTDTSGVLAAAAKQEAGNVSAADVNKAEKALTDEIPSATNINTYVQTYLSVTPTNVETSSNEITSITLDIQPMSRVVASTATKAEDIQLKEEGKTQNAVVLESSVKPINIQNMTIRIALPSSFNVNDNTSVYVQHKGYEYTATVTEESGTKYATFLNPHGFSEFTISTESQTVASIGGTNYTSLQDAVNAANDGETITVTKDSSLTASMSGSSKTIKVTNGTTESSITVTINGTAKEIAQGATETFTYTRPSHSSSGSTTYAVNVNAATNGAVAADKKTAAKGTTVTVTATPSAGYVVDSVKVVDKDGKDVAVSEKDGKYVFTMPASAVTVTASFKAETPAPSGLPFVDVKSGDWFYAAVKYAYENGLMNGTGETVFAPNGTMNRAMIVTVLYRLEKSPAVTTPAQFKDMPAGQWYSDAVAWAAANNIVNGYDETTFGPLNAVTREQMAAILYRYEQYKGMDTVTLEENLARFPDKDKVSAYAVPAMQWAVGQKVINGNADGTLDPTGTATRAQVAQIFSNLLNK